MTTFWANAFSMPCALSDFTSHQNKQRTIATAAETALVCLVCYLFFFFHFSFLSIHSFSICSFIACDYIELGQSNDACGLVIGRQAHTFGRQPFNRSNANTTFLSVENLKLTDVNTKEH